MRKANPNPRSKESPRDRASGSTDILAGADSAFAIEKGDQGFATLQCVKSREGEESQPFIVRLADNGPQSPVQLRFVGFKEDAQTATSKLQGAKEAILRFLQGQPALVGDSSSILNYLSECGVTERTGQRALAVLKDEGRISLMGKGLYELK
jgi:hypothetical protein